jgi:Family of unknown function (DUF5906)
MTELPPSLTPEEWVAVNTQRGITAAVNREVVKVGAVYLRQTSKIPVNDNWSASKYLDTNLQDWIDNEVYRLSNVGFNLQQGWVDVDVDGDDTEYNRCIHQAMRHVGVDCRLAFGRLSAQVPRHFLVQLPEEEARSFEELKRFEPKAIRLGNRRFYTECRSGNSTPNDAKQTVVPGSLYGDRDRIDVSVWWDEQGRVAKSINDVTQTTPRITNFNSLIRGIAFGTILYLIKPQWVEGSRQLTALKFNGWLARLVDESFAMNNSEQLSQEVYCPIDDDSVAESLLDFVCNSTGDIEAGMRKRTYKDARNKLSRNPDAKIPGWPAMKALLGEEMMHALREVCIPGTDTNVLMKLCEQYVYNKDDGRYIDRVGFQTAIGKFEFDAEDLYRFHKPDTIMIAGKPKEAFKSFEMSKMRMTVHEADLYPVKPPGEIFRLSRSQGIVPDEFEGGDAHLVFNTWRGWNHQPSSTIDPVLMKQCEEKLDRVLGWLTCNRAEQAQWIKEWTAWTIQNPGDKQQIAWVVIGGQGVGKSFMGNVFFSALFGNLYGMVSSKSIGERFSVAPFVGKMLVFADEVRFKSKDAVNEVKLLIRNTRTHGELKGIDARDYHIFARLMFASNEMNPRISEENVTDRALFVTKAYTPEFMNLSQLAFRDWAITHKPFFDEFTVFLRRPEVIEHYMQMFTAMPVDRHKIEDIRYSSSREPDIVLHNLSQPRKIARMIIENGYLFEGLDISTPFSQTEFLAQVTELCKKINENVRPMHVFEEFSKLEMLETIMVSKSRKFRFKWRVGELTAKFGDAIGVPIEPKFEFGPGDYGSNEHTGEGIVHWKGIGRHKF